MNETKKEPIKMENVNAHSHLLTQIVVDKLLEKYKDAYSLDIPITMENLVPRLVRLMQFVEETRGLTGLQKKEAVVTVTQELIRSSIPGKPQYEEVLADLLPVLVDMLVVADQTGLKLRPGCKNPKAFCKKLFSCC